MTSPTCLRRSGTRGTLAVAAVAALGSIAAAQPANDTCATAQVISSGFTSFDTTGAATEGLLAPASCGFGADAQIRHDIWFRYTASCTGLVTVDACGAQFDSRLAVYRGACPSVPGDVIACNDDACGQGSSVTFPGTAGTVFLIRLGGVGEEQGPGTLLVSCPPDNDDCAHATTLCMAGPVILGTLVGSTPDGSADCGGAFGTADVWYSYTAPIALNLFVDTCGTNDLGGIDHGMDTVLSLHTGCPGTEENRIVCNDDTASCPGDLGVHRDSALSWSLGAGQTVLIRVSHNSESFPGAFVLNISPLQANDLCADAINITEETRPFCTIGAATDGPAGCAANHDVWYRYSAACTGTAQANLCSSQFDTVLAVYTGSCANLTQLACNDNNGPACGGIASSVNFPVTTGGVYFIRVGGAGAATGNGLLKVTCPAPCRADWDGNGLVQPADIAAFVNVWFAGLSGGGLAGDFNGDGVLDPSDVAAFVTVWFAAVSNGC